VSKTAQSAPGPAPKRTKADVTSEKLLEICLSQFQKKGFDGTTMRDLAKAAGLSAGAFYYHFRSKEAVVQVFYEKSFLEFADRCRAEYEATKSFEKRLEGVLRARLETFESQRELLIVLSRAAVDPRSELSPFGDASTEIREATIGLFSEMLEGSDFKADKRLLPYLPTLLWMYLMGIIFFWVFDESPRQKRTQGLIELLTPQLVRLVRFTRFPLTGSVINPLLQILAHVMPQQKSA
jgi:AcrR family transcriptional regulator